MEMKEFEIYINGHLRHTVKARNAFDAFFAFTAWMIGEGLDLSQIPAHEIEIRVKS